MQFDYIAVGHVTVDVLEDGTSRPGGTALYSALQAARLGLRALILTRGVEDEIEGLLEPWAGELELQIQRAPATTRFATSGAGAARGQRLLAWAGPLQPSGRLECAILHLAPVAAELPASWPTGGRLLGLTPQGLVRSWAPGGGAVGPASPSAGAIVQAALTDAVVLSRLELAVCEQLVARARDGGALVALTAGEQPSTILVAGADPIVQPVCPIEQPVDDLGAGDVFAAALFTGLAEGRPPAQAGALANAAAALRMTGAGPEAVARRERIEAVIPRTG